MTHAPAASTASVPSALFPAYLSAAPRGTVTLAVLLAFVTYIYFAYRPQPIPGVPYDKSIGFFGNMPELLRNAKKGDGMYRMWIGEAAHKFKSPIFQFWIMPFQRTPIVALTDYTESNDIMLRRSKEFDRGPRTIMIMGTVVPHNMIAMQSHDPRFKRNRELMKDLMLPKFIKDVNAPEIHAKTLHLVELLAEKTRVGKGRPFEAYKDVQTAALDIILAAAVYWEDKKSLVKPAVEGLRTGRIGPVGPVPNDENKPVVFDHIHVPEQIEALITVVDSIELAFTSPAPKWHHWILKQTIWRRAFALKEKFITDEMDAAVDRLSAGIGGKGRLTCAMDQIVVKEMQRAQEENRTPDFSAPELRDELFGYLVAGHDTAATTLGWSLKFTADNPAAQATLRRQLRAAYPNAVAENRSPSAEEIADANKHPVPYLEAYVEECLRIARTASVNIRVATQDTTVLGHALPKGTAVMMSRIGPSFMGPRVEVDDKLRSPGARAAKAKEAWDESTLHLFEPGRFLRGHEAYGGSLEKTVSNGDGRMAGEKGEFDDYEFDPHGAPFLSFSVGPRSCFGRRLAYLELRMVIALLIWNFEFLPVAPELNSYHAIDALVSRPKQCYVKLRKL